MNEVEQLYDQNPQREWERLERHRTEFAVTLRALQIYLPSPPAAVLDIGGGPGRYAIALAQRGYGVTLLDLSQKCLALARERAHEQGVELAATIHGDATSLPSLPQVTYDAVLLLGPLYHLLTLPERRQAVAEAKRVLNDGGVLFAAFITRFAPLRMAARYPDWIQQYPQRFQEIFERGINKARPGAQFPNAYFAHPEEIRPFMETAGFEWLNLIGCEGIVAGHEEEINQVSGPLWEQWVDLNYKLGQEPTLYGAADHLLYIGRKR